jgi:FkbM family methyltransferase
VKVDTLDNYVTRHNLQVGLIKVDIEGYEQKFLAGAVNTIKKQKPIFL